MSERDKLIQNNEVEQGNNTLGDGARYRPRIWRFLLAIPVILVFYMSVFTFKYIISEWTQHKCEQDYFVNTSYSKKNQGCSVLNQTSDEKERHDEVQHDTSLWNLYYRVAEYAPLIVSNLLFPSLSDSYGRKFLLTLSSFSVILKLCIGTVVFYADGSQWFIVVACLAEAVTGGYRSLTCAFFSITADITTPDQRVLGIVLMHTTELLATTFSSGLSGVLIETVSLGFVWSALSCCIAALSCGFILTCLIPETLDKTKKVNPSVIGALKRPLMFYTSEAFKGMRKNYILLLLIFTLSELILSGRTELETIYLLGKPFCYDPANIGYFMMVRHAAGSFIGMASLKPLMHCLSSEAITQMSIVSAIGSYVMEGLAQSTLILYTSAVVGMLNILASPLLRGMLSTITPPDKQGSLFASVSVVEAIGSVVSSTFSSTLYAQTVSIWPGLVFEGLAALGIVNIVVLFYYICHKAKTNRKTHTVRVTRVPS